MALRTHYTLNCAGGRIVHSYGRLIPHEFPITDLQQISGPDGIGRITCTVSSGTPRFHRLGGELQTGGVTQTMNEDTATLVVNPSNGSSFQNRGLYCANINTNFFYLFISSTSKFTQTKQCIQYAYSAIQVLVYNYMNPSPFHLAPPLPHPHLYSAVYQYY